MQPLDFRRHFLDVCNDLERKIQSNREYDILKASGLLRELLFDARPLVHQVNAPYKLKLRFEIGVSTPVPASLGEPAFWSKQDGLYPPDGRPGTRTAGVDLDGLLAAPVLRTKGTSFTVRDIIDFEANVMGGVHPGVPQDDKEAQLAAIRTLFMGDLPVSLSQLKAISKVVLKGLEPLRQQINRDLVGRIH
jgi:hypothetical protein